MDLDFSVIVPTRGDTPHLRAAMASALRTSAPVELLLVHDVPPGQAELTAGVAGVTDDSRVRVLRAAGPGPAMARNTGLDAARGSLVAFLDDDDLWLPFHLDRSRAVLAERADAIGVASDAYLFTDPSADGSGRPPEPPTGLPRFAPPGQKRQSLTLRAMLLANRVLTPTVVLRRDWLTADDRFDPTLDCLEDYDLWLRLLRRHEMVFDPVPTVVVRRRDGSASADSLAMAAGALRVLERELGRDLPPGTLSARERRIRLGRLRHDLAHAYLVRGDTESARAAALRSARHLPLLGKNYIYLLASLVPGPLRARWVRARQGRRAPAGRRTGRGWSR